YFRILIPTNDKPALIAASVLNTAVAKPVFYNYEVQLFSVLEEKASKQTSIELILNKVVPVSFIQLNIPNKFDFYRPVTVRQVIDSVKTANGWEYIYETIANSMLHSAFGKTISFKQAIGKRFSLIIENEDNIPLNISSVEVKGYEHVLTARFDNPSADYYLLYGNKMAAKPNYDLMNFADKIPHKLTKLTVGKEQLIETAVSIAVKPLFENKLWLWLIMGFIIVVIGWFSISMLKKD
ncbi:MAG: hypothetical protein ACOVNR_09625, partial [Chitinophagaceae bacterium]